MDVSNGAFGGMGFSEDTKLGLGGWPVIAEYGLNRPSKKPNLKKLFLESVENQSRMHREDSSLSSVTQDKVEEGIAGVPVGRIRGRV
jgi:hypothetical protein